MTRENTQSLMCQYCFYTFFHYSDLENWTKKHPSVTRNRSFLRLKKKLPFFSLPHFGWKSFSHISHHASKRVWGSWTLTSSHKISVCSTGAPWEWWRQECKLLKFTLFRRIIEWRATWEKGGKKGRKQAREWGRKNEKTSVQSWPSSLRRKLLQREKNEF